MSSQVAGAGLELMFTWTMDLALLDDFFSLLFQDRTGSITAVAGCLAISSPL